MNNNEFPHSPAIYEILIKGRLDARWSQRFEGLTISSLPDGRTILKGCIADQPALHAILNLINSLGLVLISVERLRPCSTPDEKTGKRTG